MEHASVPRDRGREGGSRRRREEKEKEKEKERVRKKWNHDGREGHLGG